MLAARLAIYYTDNKRNEKLWPLFLFYLFKSGIFSGIFEQVRYPNSKNFQYNNYVLL